MSLITITKDMKKPDYEEILVGSDAKNALPSRIMDASWTEITGLSWLFIEDDYS